MECLHAMRFWVRLQQLHPCMTQEEWSEVYEALQRNPHLRCGCPNQVIRHRAG